MGAVWAIVVAAGTGERFGGAKQFCDLRGTRVVDRSVLTAAGACDGVVVVVPPGHAWDGPDVDAAVAGGATRSESVRRGLDVVPPGVEVVVVHDAARPLATPALFAEVIDAVRGGAAGAIVATPVADTPKRVAGDRVVETLERDTVRAAQTPQAFRADVLQAAHATDASAGDDSALVEAAGFTVVVVPGDPANLKITTPADLVVAAALLDGSAV